MAVRIQLNRTAIRAVPIELVTPFIRDVGGQVERGARRAVRVRSGAVRASIRSTFKISGTKVTKSISATHERAMLEHEGAKAHTIAQRPGGPMLRFYWTKVGHVVYFTRVNHPGTKGSKFLTSPLLLYGLRNGFTVTIKLGGVPGTITP